MGKLKFFLAAVILLALCGCIEEKQSATHVNFELISVMKDNSTYKAVVFIKSIERNKSIPVSAFLVKTKTRCSLWIQKMSGFLVQGE